MRDKQRIERGYELVITNKYQLRIGIKIELIYLKTVLCCLLIEARIKYAQW